jgi:hypothetical protein
VQQDVPPPAHHVQIGPAVVVDVAPETVGADAVLVIELCHARRAGDVGERAVAVVPIEAVGLSLLRIGEIEIDPAVLVEVARRRRGTDRGHPRHDRGKLRIEDRFVVDMSDAGGGLGRDKMNRRSGWCEE